MERKHAKPTRYDDNDQVTARILPALRFSYQARYLGSLFVAAAAGIGDAALAHDN